MNSNYYDSFTCACVRLLGKSLFLTYPSQAVMSRDSFPLCLKKRLFLSFLSRQKGVTWLRPLDFAPHHTCTLLAPVVSIWSSAGGPHTSLIIDDFAKSVCFHVAT